MITFEEEKDMMTFEEAKDVFLNHGWIKVEGGTYFDGNKWREAVRVLGDYLQREPCNDAISRQTVLDAMSELNAISFYEAQEDSKECYYEIQEMVKNMPPVIPQPKMGHWILHQNYNSDGLGFEYFSCSECDDQNDEKSRYCPNCGVKMDEVEK